MPEYLLVDGYNVLHAWTGLENILGQDLQHARTKLVHTLGNYQALKGIKVITVFDAHLVRGGSGSRELESGVEVIYTVEGETADSVIEKMTNQLVSEGNRVTVATSDWTEQRVVLGMGAVRLSARELQHEIEAEAKEVQHFMEKLTYGNRNLREHLNEKIKDSLEKMRRQK